MNPIFRLCTAAVATLLLGVAAGSAQATVLTIDPARSSVTYTFGGVVLCDPDGNCPEPPASQTFALSGSFELERTTAFVTDWFYPHAGYYRDEIRFRSVAVDGGGAMQMGFSFPTYLALADGEDFAGSENHCMPPMGFCLMVPFDSFSGRLDGRTLTMAGTDFVGSDLFSDRFAFTVVAQAAAPASVPEPGTLACLATALFGLGIVRRRGVITTERPAGGRSENVQLTLGEKRGGLVLPWCPIPRVSGHSRCR